MDTVWIPFDMYPGILEVSSMESKFKSSSDAEKNVDDDSTMFIST